MDVSRVESEPPDEPDDLLPLLDEELNRLPDRYRAALVACELEGKSRREAAAQLGIPEGTLSTHLARGRKLLRERLRRRGVDLGLGPIAGSAVPERLMGPTVRAAVDSTRGAVAAGAVPASVCSLAERAIKMMFLARLSLIVAALITAAAGAVAAVVVGWPATVATPQKPDDPAQAKAGPDDLDGRVVDQAGKGVADVQVWATDGPWRTPETVARAATDAQGRFVMPPAVTRVMQANSQNFGLFARARDGRVGWWRPVSIRPGIEIELDPVGDARGRLTDQDARPIAGVEIAPAAIIRTNVDGIWLSPEPAALLRTTTAADGSFVLRGIPIGARINAAIEAPAFGSPTIWWDTTQSVTVALDGRLGRIEGRLRSPDARGLEHPFSLSLERAPRPDGSAAGPFEMTCSRSASAARDGTFRFDHLPPGRYVVGADFEQDGLIAVKDENEVEVGPGAVAQLEIPLQRLPMITGRLVDAKTGKGVAGVGLYCVLLEEGKRSNRVVGQATTDAEGRYRMPARPGKIMVNLQDVPRTHLGIDYGDFPRLEVKADQNWPDLKLSPATDLDGLVVNESGRPVAGAEVYVYAADRFRVIRTEPILTGADGTFRVDQLDPDHRVSLWARSGDATTDGTVTVRPREVQGKLRVAIDPKHSLRIRGLATDNAGKRLARAEVTLRWHRPFPVENPQEPSGALGSPLGFAATGDNGWFVFRGLWPGLSYDIVIQARGHNKAEAPDVTGKAGETRDVGKLVLISMSGYLAGRVVGSDGRPIGGAAVYNRGDGPEPAATSTDPEGRFRLDGLFPGSKYAFVRKQGYRFTGVKVDDDADGLAITLLRTDEPPPPWKPGSGPGLDGQRAFARQVLIRLWEKYGADADNNGAISCIGEMAAIDPELAMRWSAEKGHRHDDDVRHAEARNLAETDATAALALLNQKPDRWSQDVIQQLADRFAEADPARALRFAEEAAAQSRGLNQPDRTMAMARAGAVLVKLGRADAGRKLIDDAARDAAPLPVANWAGSCRAAAACALAPHDLERALALVEPFKGPDPQRWQGIHSSIAIAIARTDTRRALELVDTMGATDFDRQMARTAIAYRIGRDQPDAAIRIIEGVPHDQDSIWQAEAFGWLAAALAPRDRARANALIDRALALVLDDPGWVRLSARSGGNMAGAAHIAACARRIGYPDMDSVIMRVMAARPGRRLRALDDRNELIGALAASAVPLALLDPDAARTVLEQIEARGGIDPVGLPDAREAWLTAWALVDLTKAAAIFDAELAALDQEKEARLWSTGFSEMVELLSTPPNRRETALKNRPGGASWQPDGE